MLVVAKQPDEDVELVVDQDEYAYVFAIMEISHFVTKYGWKKVTDDVESHILANMGLMNRPVYE